MFCAAGVFVVEFFMERELFQYMQSTSEDPKLLPRVFIDLGDLQGSPTLPEELNGTQAFVFFSSSPGGDEVRRKSKWFYPKIILMNPWTEAEVQTV